MKRFFRIFFFLLLIPILYLVSVIGYAWLTDFQPSEKENAEILALASATTLNTDTLNFISWNIGYAGLAKETDFFLDGGKTVRVSQEITQRNLDSIAGYLMRRFAPNTFVLLQEVDKDSRRTYNIDEVKYIQNKLKAAACVYGKNYDVKYIPKPWLEPVGKIEAGIAQYSSIAPAQALKYDFLSEFDDKLFQLFFLDRCFTATAYQLSSGKKLMVLNTHNSAYDDTGKLKAQELKQMKEVAEAAYKEGYYVIAGGDWNQYPPEYKGVKNHPVRETNPDNFMPKDYPQAGWNWAYDAETPTNRSLVSPFDADTSYRTVIDYFLVSPNVEVLTVKTQNMGFSFSDHQPVEMRVRLK